MGKKSLLAMTIKNKREIIREELSYVMDFGKKRLRLDVSGKEKRWIFLLSLFKLTLKMLHHISKWMTLLLHQLFNWKIVCHSPARYASDFFFYPSTLAKWIVNVLSNWQTKKVIWELGPSRSRLQWRYHKSWPYFRRHPTRHESGLIISQGHRLMIWLTCDRQLSTPSIRT